ncbi:MAG: HigA family addiction module antitoxin [Candidatus Korobacteraceae bacterium]
MTAYVVMRYLLSVPSPNHYSTPGQLIQELLERRGWSQRILAIILRADETGINRLIAGKRAVDAQMAIQLGEVFGIRPEHFLQLQRRYDLAQARLVSRPDPDRAMRARVFGELPVAEMIKRGWIDAEDVRDVPKVEAALLTFFHAPTLDDIEILKHRPKKTGIDPGPTPTQLAWMYRVKEIASEMLVARYSPSAVREAVKKLSPLLSSAEAARKVPRILAESGIRFVIAESLASAKIDGVTFWLNDVSPVIGMTLRHDRIDNFWFVLRHEIEHVLRLHGRENDIIDVLLEGERAGTGPNISEEEKVANEAAAEFCVPQESLKRFIVRKEPFFAERDILGFANTLRIHPGLVAGQLQHKTLRYDRFRNHLVKIRAAVTPSAMVDGWGDVAPV